MWSQEFILFVIVVVVVFTAVPTNRIKEQTLSHSYDTWSDESFISESTEQIVWKMAYLEWELNVVVKSNIDLYPSYIHSGAKRTIFLK